MPCGRATPETAFFCPLGYPTPYGSVRLPNSGILHLDVVHDEFAVEDHEEDPHERGAKRPVVEVLPEAEQELPSLEFVFDVALLTFVGRTSQAAARHARALRQGEAGAPVIRAEGTGGTRADE
jgi:hypothetical protein